jgi:hypothetical protein
MRMVMNMRVEYENGEEVVRACLCGKKVVFDNG